MGLSEGKWGKIGVNRADIPSRLAIIKINETFGETGCVDKSLLKSSLVSQKTRFVTFGLLFLGGHEGPCLW